MLALDCAEIRTELSKLEYPGTNFQLYRLADAPEALERVIGILHAWESSVSNSPSPPPLEVLIASSCSRKPCTLH